MYKIQYHIWLHLGESIEGADFITIQKKLRENPLEADVYLITLAANEKEQLDIFHSKYLLQRYYGKHIPYVIGIARSKEEAVSVVEKLVSECVKERGDADLKAYLNIKRDIVE